MPELVPNPNPKHVLIVAPHPDDGEFMAGGTLAHWSANGASIHYLLITDGTGGSRDPSQTQAQLARIRREEQRNAARILGAEDITFLGYPDGRVEASLELRLAIARVIRRVRPDVVVSFDPLFRYSPTYINHPDHRAVADATLAAIMPTANTLLSAPELIEEGLEPHDVSEVYLAMPVTATIWVPLTEANIARKVESLRAHVSQMSDWNPEPLVREWAANTAQQAREHGIECEFAESFAYVRLHTPPTEEPANVKAQSSEAS